MPEVKMDRRLFLSTWTPLFKNKYGDAKQFRGDVDALIEAEIERGYQEGFSAGLRKAEEALDLGRKVTQAIRKGGAQ